MEIMMANNKFRIVIITIVSITLLIGTTAIFTGFSHNEAHVVTNENPAVTIVNLNKTLTNEMSDTSSLAGLDKKLKLFMRKWQFMGISLSVMRNDSLVYAKGYGWADEQEKIRMAPSNILRLASISKLITATGIMVLQEKGLLSLKDTVFGERGILKDSAYLSSIKDRNYYKITVEDLLRHKAGFTARGGDPMFSTRYIIMRNRLEKAPDHITLMKCVMKKPLGYLPGTSQAYSNFGYLLLSKIIEEVSGQTYEDFIQENVLKPAGCLDFHIANTYYKGKYPNEVKYYTQVDDQLVPEYNNSGREVVRCYGGNDITSLSGAGAWVGSTPELALFVASIDGRPEVPDIISKQSADAMVEYFDGATYSLGWNDTNPEIGWTRSGTFSGTSALIKYFPDGECWILVTNTSTWKGPGMSRVTASLFSELRRTFSVNLPARNLFDS